MYGFNTDLSLIGVVTKPDLVDRGAEAEVLAVVKNERYMLKKGYTIIKCRGQQAINAKQSLAEATEEEITFFQTHDHFGFVHFLILF